MEHKQYTLKHPIPWAGETISAVRVGRPKMKHIRAAEGERDEISKNLSLVAGVTGLEEEVIEEMDPVDFAAVVGILAAFLPKSPRTGKR